MKHPLARLLLGLALLASPACIYVHVTSDLDEEILGDIGEDAGFPELKASLGSCVANPHYDVDLTRSPWRRSATWTVRFEEAGSDPHAAFRKAREAVLARIQREGGTVTRQEDEGPHAWSCAFRISDEPGEASVRLEEEGDEGESSPELLVRWKRSD
jgi:hypothetical protein